MAPNSPRLRILSVGGNAVSAFLSWRLQATNACDVTLVWKSGYETVSQYGISFKSSLFGNERFKPRQVVRSPEEAANRTGRGSYDYVLLCVKALPDVYDLASVIESVVTPQHTCILINTSNSLGVERAIEERFPQNVVLSLVSHANITQLAPSEFQHEGSTELWVGPANWNPEIPVSIQSDMADALAMTLSSGEVECKVSKNIQQQQFERMIGPIAFHTTSVLFETPNHADLLALNGVRALISDTIDEMIRVAEAKGCTFATNFRDATMEEMIAPKDTQSVMYQDYAARRPMEVETYLGAPLKVARDINVKVPRIETLYAMLHHVNIANQKRSGPPIESAPQPQPQPPVQTRMSSLPQPRPGNPNGSSQMRPPYGPNGRASRAPSMTGPPPGMMRRGPPPPGYGPGPAQNGAMPPRQMGPPMQRRPSFDHGLALDDFSHVVMIDDGFDDGGFVDENASPSHMNMRHQDPMARQKEFALRERDMHMHGNGRASYANGRQARPPPSHFGDEDEDGEDYFDPMAYRGPPVDPDNVDMMSITSRRTRKQPSVSQLRNNPEMAAPRGRGGPFGGRPGAARNRTSSSRAILDSGVPFENVAENPLFEYADNRYGAVDRVNMGRESRTNSLTAARLDELAQGSNYGGYPPPTNRRPTQSPGMALGASQRRPMPNGGYPANGNFPPNASFPGPYRRGASPPGMRQPVPRHPPGHGNAVAPQGIEQRAGRGEW